MPSRVYNLSNLHLAAGTYYIEVSIHDSWKLSSLEEYNIMSIEKTIKLAVTGDQMHEAWYWPKRVLRSGRSVGKTF